MSDIQISLTEAQYLELQRQLADVPKQVPRAAAAAINRTVETGATRIRKVIAQLLGMGVRKVGKRVKPIKTDARELRGRIRLYNYNIPMIQTRQIPVKGGRYPLDKIDALRQLRNSPFQQKMLSGHVGWFVRHGTPRVMEKGRYQGKIREPIKQVYALAPRKLWEETPGLAGEELAKLGPNLSKNLASQVERFTK